MAGRASAPGPVHPSTVMRRWFSLLVALLALAAVPGYSRAAPGGTRRALLVGIDAYEPPAGPDGQPVYPPGGRREWRSLSGCLNDVEAMRTVLETRYGFRPEHVRVLKDREASREAILSGIRRTLIDEAQPGDVCLFYYAGHGSQVKNLKSTEQDQQDETIVPADACTGARDIRDKELRRLFDQSLDRGAQLTLIFDCCHSGSITRGYPRKVSYRALPPDPRPVSDAEPPGFTPEEKGALVFAAAQDFEGAAEDEDEAHLPRGAFSLALGRAMQCIPVDAPADQLLITVKATLQARGITQLPVLSGKDHEKKALFGRAAEPPEGRASVTKGPGEAAGGTAVALLDSGGTGGEMVLQGGRAAGVNEGCILRQLRVAPDHKRVKVQVTSGVRLTDCKAKLIEGDRTDLRPGELFEIERWTAPDQANLRVWIPAATLPRAEVERMAGQLASLRASGQVDWVDDPTADPPVSRGEARGGPPASCVLFWDANGWKLALPSGKVEALGRAPSAQAVLARLPRERGARPRVFVHLPPPAEVGRELGLGANGTYNAIDVTTRERANYILVGRMNGKTLEYAWVMPGVTEAEAARSLPMPARTDWVTIGGGVKGARDAARQLENYALRLGKVKAWLELAAPPDDGRFPYHLTFRNVRTKETTPGGPLVDGQGYAFVLRTTAAELARARPIQRRYVYVFVIDDQGKSTLLFPPDATGGVENRVPFERPDEGPPALEIPLSDLNLTVEPPLGIDTYFMLSTVEPLPNPLILDSDGVRHRRDGATPLETLLVCVGADTRGAGKATFVNWSLQRIPVRSVGGVGGRRWALGIEA